MTNVSFCVVFKLQNNTKQIIYPFVSFETLKQHKTKKLSFLLIFMVSDSKFTILDSKFTVLSYFIDDFRQLKQ